MGYIIAFFILYNLKPITGGAFVLKFLPNMVLLIGILRYAFFRRGKVFLTKLTFESNLHLYGIFLAFLVVSLIRTAYPNATFTGILNDSLTILLLNLLVYVFISFQFRQAKNFDEVFTDTTLKIILVPSIIIAAFLLAYVFGYNHPSAEMMREGEGAVLLRAVGINMPKKTIPFTYGTHPNTVSIFAGGILVMTMVALFELRLKAKARFWLWMNVVSCLAFMIVADSRGTVLNFVVAMGMVFLTTRVRFTGALRAFILVVPWMPFLFISLLQILATTGILASFSRTGDTENITTLSSRTVIWEACMEEMADLKPIHLIGWGEHGESPAGASAKYEDMFREDQFENDLIVTHNMFFQAFFDVGYLGIFFFLATLFYTMNNAIFLQKRGFKAGLVYIGFILYFTLSGTLESTFGNHNRSYFIIWMLTLMTVITFKNEYVKLAARGDD